MSAVLSPLPAPMAQELRRPVTLTHLQRLEAESIDIMREAVAETENPVMLYSIGKDSSVMLHLAMKAFYPVEAAVPAAARRHDVEVPRDDRVSRPHRERSSGLELLVHVNPEARRWASTRSRTARRCTPTSGRRRG